MKRPQAIQQTKGEENKHRLVNPPPRDLSQWEYWWAEAREIIPRGTQTFDEMEACKVSQRRQVA
ncbi:MAG: hypothetical protein L7F78_11740 [Syntrophales bacterium LBB04]|nr:hypothetical protein [Syntrophales bacterium LBB04]